MAGLFDNIFGGAGGMYADMLSPEQQAAMRRQGMLQVAAKLLEGSGPSPVRRTLGQTLGGALSAGAEAMQSGQTNAVQQMLLKQKLDEAKLQKDQAARIAEIFGASQPAPTPLTGVDAINAPGAAVGPTMSRAAAIGTMPAGPSKADYAAKYRQAANVSASDPVKAKAYMDIANQLAPQEKFSTTPQFGRSAAGTPISYVLSEDGGMKVLNVQQNPDFSYQDMGGYISVRDKRNNQEVEQIKKTMSASEIASNQVALGNLGVARGQLGVAQGNLALSRDRSAREAFEIKETPDGLFYVPKAPGAAATAMPVMGAGGTQLSGSGSKPTEDQSKSAGFAFRMQEATKIFNQPVMGKDGKPILDPKTQKPITLEQAYGRPGYFQAIMRDIPSAGLTTGIANWTEDTGRQQYRQAQENWVTANMRPESGAVIGPVEMEKEIIKYFPQANDDQATIDQKARARRDTELAVKVRAGPAFKQIEKMAAGGQFSGPRLVRGPDGLLRYVTE